MKYHKYEHYKMLSAWCDGSLDDVGLSQLDQLIRTDAEFLRVYLEYMDLHATLASDILTGSTLPLVERGGREVVGDWEVFSSRQRMRLDRIASKAGISTSIVAAAIILACLIGVKFARRNSARNPLPQAAARVAEMTDESVAVLAKEVNARWDPTSPPVRVGSPLLPGHLKLISGLVRLEFYCGAVVILEGPADLELLSTSSAFCHKGKLRAHVPPQARGFAVGSPRLDLVDLGTEFGMSVGESNRIEVRVFDGVVELQETGPNRRATSSQRLTTGEVLRIDGSGGPGSKAENPETYVSLEELSDRADTESRTRLREWRTCAELLDKDPDLQLHYTFEHDGRGGRTLHDQAGNRAGSKDGTIIGCRWVDGRWPGKGALEFRRVGDRVRFDLPGVFESLSMMAWVRLDDFDNPINSLMQTDGFEPGEAHWQVLQAGNIALGIQATIAPNYGNYKSSPFFSRDEMGQWTHLAVVYDASKKRVTHYANGRALHSERTQFEIPIRIGAAEIGNWNPKGYFDKRPIRNWNGIIDEFMIYSRALSETEVERHYSQGYPRS